MKEEGTKKRHQGEEKVEGRGKEACRDEREGRGDKRCRDKRRTHTKVNEDEENMRR